MGNYINSVDHISKQKIIEKVVEKECINMFELAEAVANAISKNMTFNATNMNRSLALDTFDDTKTLQRMSEAMTIQKGGNEANFDELGEEKKTKTNNDTLKKTINLLINLKD